MSSFTNLRLAHSFALLAVPLVACGTDTPDDEPLACARGTLEPDLGFLSPMAGPAVDPATGAIAPPPPGGYVVSTTYLALRPEPAAQQRFGELNGPIGQALATAPGLLAIQFGSSPSCGTARTFTIWRDEDAMYAYVTGPAHSAAIAAITEVSRGGSVATHWISTSTAQMTWEAAAAQLTAFDGRIY